MRTIVNISVPAETARYIDTEVARGNFEGRSDFFRHLVDEWKSRDVIAGIITSAKHAARGKRYRLRSLADLD